MRVLGVRVCRGDAGLLSLQAFAQTARFSYRRATPACSDEGPKNRVQARIALARMGSRTWSEFWNTRD